jgi:hypothetical protein
MLCGVAAGCAGSLDPSIFASSGTGGTGGGTVCNAATTVIQPMCGIPGCHGTTAPASGLDLTATGLVARLLDMKPTAASQLCASNTTPFLQSASSPATGLFLQKLTATPPCGVQMPQGGMLGASDMTCVNAWATAVTTGVITQ